ncbi:MAG TPA: cysteine rich repeat-containing protein [Phyllobacterium sp.]|nr:cysteine rich repeat-containing protein [Phyllobacterium sp.]
MILSVIGIGLFCSTAIAQTAAERAACMADFQKYCPGVVPGGGRIIECLAKQLDKLTPECKKVVQSHAPK